MMNEPLLDFPDHVQRTEPIRKRELEALAFDQDDGPLEEQLRALMIELEDIQEETRSIWEFRNDYPVADSLAALQEQKRRLTKWANGK
ncbi:hypothetical protein [Brevibacillus sp. 1238]|uniref:hypothetical protein n=1 Tax=Brevibacillus sp. 1238 TaxID=2940565 RepID=UPI002476FA7B|nr:hypothetical protein [Brevibacillus sp. 1238]MDH6351887.1 hypothetical protein [Brevibacillus sp. 1238]